MVYPCIVTGYNPGVTGGDILKFLPGAKANGLADMYVSVADDVYSMHYNPAGIAFANKSFGSMYVKGLVDTQYGFLGYLNPMGKAGTLGASLLYFYGGEIDIQGSSNFNNAVTGKMVAMSDFLLTLSYGYKLPDKNLSFGLNTKIFYSNLVETYSALALGFDFGARYALASEKIAFGLAVQNLGSGIKYLEVSDPMQGFLRAGVSYRTRSEGDLDLLAGVDLEYPFANKLRYNFGSEILYRKMYALRIGYKLGHDVYGLTVGAGFRDYRYSVDYTFMPAGTINTSAHRVSVSMNLFTPKEKATVLIKSGMDSYKKKRYRTAVSDFEKVLKLYPDNKKVKSMIKKAEAKLRSSKKKKK